MANNFWEAKVSVGVVLSNHRYETPLESINAQLVMVRKRKTGLLGLAAGKLNPGETDVEAIIREIGEETGLGVDDLEMLCGLPKVRVLPSGTVTLVGVVFEAYLKNPLPKKGRRVDSEEIDWVRPVGIKELKKIEKSGGKGLFMPEFNLPAIVEFLDDSVEDYYWEHFY